MFQTHKRDDGVIVAPVRVESADGVVGDAIGELRPGDPMYDQWDEWLTRTAPESD